MISNKQIQDFNIINSIIEKSYNKFKKERNGNQSDFYSIGKIEDVYMIDNSAMVDIIEISEVVDSPKVFKSTFEINVGVSENTEANTFIYSTNYNADQNEGRWPSRDLNINFENEVDAIIFVESRYYGEKYGVMGCPGSKYNTSRVNKQTLIPNIYKDISDFEKKTGISISMTAEEIKRHKLNSMSKEELVEQAMQK